MNALYIIEHKASFNILFLSRAKVYLIQSLENSGFGHRALLTHRELSPVT